jgi:DNA-binding transcriptional MerR regulator
VAAKRELFKSSDVCELTQLQAYVLRSWEAEFPHLGKPATNGAGRLYKRTDVDLVLRIKDLVFREGLTLAGARRRLEEEDESPGTSVAAVAVDSVLDEFARTKLREVRTGLEAILQLVSRGAPPPPPELTLVAPAVRVKGSAKAAGKRR